MSSPRSTIAERLDQIRERVAAAAVRSGRAPDAVGIVAVSKTKPAALIREAIAAGCVDFGENYVQELQEKAAALASLKARWHFIGHAQRNKAKALVDVAGLSLVHGVDSVRLAHALDAKAERALDVLIQVNVSGEASKSGCAPEQAAELLAAIASSQHLRCRGLMTMPPEGDPEEARPLFRKLRVLRDSLGEALGDLPELSMGMSHDFEVAIEEGATLVRVGSAIFGPRE